MRHKYVGIVCMYIYFSVDYTYSDRGELMGFVGCYKDAADRDLDGYYMSNAYLRLGMCIDECKNRGKDTVI